MGAAWFVWGQGAGTVAEGEAEAGAVAGESGSKTAAEKKGFAGVVQKVKNVFSGGTAKTPDLADGAKGDTAEGGGSDSLLADAAQREEMALQAGAEDKSLEERNELMKNEFGEAMAGPGGQEGLPNGEIPDQLPEGVGLVSANEAQAATRRGGAFGSSTGTVKAIGQGNDYFIWKGDLATAGSDLRFEVVFKEAGGQLQYRCFLMPYDIDTSKFFRADKGDLRVSFHSEDDKRLVPKDKKALSIPLTKMTAFESKGQVAGWVARGLVPLEGQDFSAIKGVALGWDFDEELGDWLKELSESR